MRPVIKGRAKESETLVSHIREKKHLHIYGNEGTGKSALLDWALDNWKQIDDSVTPVYCRESRTLRGLVFQAASILLQHFGPMRVRDKFGRESEFRSCNDLERATIPELKQMVYKNIPRKKFYVILDHLEHVTPLINSVLTVLYERASVITASRQSWEITDYAFRGSMAYHGLYLAPKLRVCNMGRHDAFAFMKKIFMQLKIDANGQESLMDKIWVLTRGNPGMMSKVISKASKPEYRIAEDINLKLIIIDLKIENIEDPLLRVSI